MEEEEDAVKWSVDIAGERRGEEGVGSIPPPLLETPHPRSQKKSG